jgi:hypothetical protein
LTDTDEVVKCQNCYCDGYFHKSEAILSCEY